MSVLSDSSFRNPANSNTSRCPQLPMVRPVTCFANLWDTRRFEHGFVRSENFMNMNLSRLAIAMLTATLVLAGCSATRPVVSEWSHPGYSSASFKRIMVGGVDPKTSIRRIFEDEFVAQLRSAGIDALPSYRHIPEDEKIEEAKIKQAAQQAGADAVILARAVSIEQKTDYGPSYYPVPVFGIFGSHGGAMWSGPYG